MYLDDILIILASGTENLQPFLDNVITLHHNIKLTPELQN